ncbi:MAG TPA: MBL fold metallo-hydrolase [Candidatus Accumulibacter phosphatis]|nr:MBL fold metallo-hydrolase [Candidatus Accumulibacter phosphatis]
MKKIILPLLFIASLLGSRGLLANADVDRAVQALGGASALAAVSSLQIRGTLKHWEPDQSLVPGGEKRFAGDSSFTLTRDFGSGAARIDWQRQLAYPAAREYRFSEVMVGDAGHVFGIDSTARTSQSRAADPPGHAMSSVRLRAAMRELERSSPLLALDMQRHAAQITVLPPVKVGGRSHAALRYALAGRDFVVLFDPASGLPARVRSLDYDFVRGDLDFDLVLSDWRPVAGIQVAHRQVYELAGEVVAETTVDSVTINPPPLAGQFDLPATPRPPALAIGEGVPAYQWVLRRQYIGVFLDSDMLAWDAGASRGLTLQEIADNVLLVQGGSHNSLIVELPGSLVVFDAPINDAQAQWTLAALRQKFPHKRVRHLVLTHHHMDHIAGARSFIAAGATLVVGAGAADHYRRMAAAPHRRNPVLAGSVGEPRIIEVSDRLSISDGGREVLVLDAENPHATAMLIGYVPDARLGFVTDLWSPGRDALGSRLGAGQAAVVAAVARHAIVPERFAGGHGSVAPYAPLAQLAGN